MNVHNLKDKSLSVCVCVRIIKINTDWNELFEWTEKETSEDDEERMRLKRNGTKYFNI